MASKDPKPWAQRPFFRNSVDLWIARTGKAKKDLAEAVGIEPGSLKQYYSGSQIPGRDLALRFAKELGCQISELLGEPSEQQGGVVRDEAFANIMGILGPNMTEELKAHLIGIAQAAQPRPAPLDLAAEPASPEPYTAEPTQKKAKAGSRKSK